MLLPIMAKKTGSTAKNNNPTRCWNCWSTKHDTPSCSAPTLTLRHREDRRLELDVPPPKDANYFHILKGEKACFNCWASCEHGYPTCPKKNLDVQKREMLRIKMGMLMMRGGRGCW